MFADKPEVFFAIIIATSILALVFVSALAFREARIQKKIAAELETSSKGFVRKIFQKSLLSLAMLWAIIFLVAMPKIKSEFLRAETVGEISFMFDNTKSMDARKTPAGPSRLERSKDIGLSILEDLKFVDASICSFGGTVNCLVPPSTATGDKKILRGVIQDFIVPDETLGRGSNIIGSLRGMAEELKLTYGSNTPPVVVFTDGEETISPDFKDLLHIKDSGVLFIFIGVGEREGAKIPKFSSFDGRFIEQYEIFKGAPYVSFLKEEYLERLAGDIGGKYFFEEDRHKITQFVKSNVSRKSGEGKKHEQSHLVSETPRYIEVPSLAAIILLLAVFVRKHVF